MAITSTDLLKEGMVLEAPVKNAQGQVLFGIGHELKEKHIEMMMAWGIAEGDVKMEEQDDEAAQRLKEAIFKEEEFLKPRFKRCNLSNPIIQETLRFVAERRVEKQQGKTL